MNDITAIFAFLKYLETLSSATWMSTVPMMDAAM